MGRGTEEGKLGWKRVGSRLWDGKKVMSTEYRVLSVKNVRGGKWDGRKRKSQNSGT